MIDRDDGYNFAVYGLKFRVQEYKVRDLWVLPIRVMLFMGITLRSHVERMNCRSVFCSGLGLEDWLVFLPCFALRRASVGWNVTEECEYSWNAGDSVGRSVTEKRTSSRAGKSVTK